jgi:hypothetical protein
MAVQKAISSKAVKYLSESVTGGNTTNRNENVKKYTQYFPSRRYKMSLFVIQLQVLLK